MVNRFDYEQEGELQFGDSQCSLCMYYNDNERDICKMFSTGKTMEILEDKKLCPHIKFQNEIILE